MTASGKSADIEITQKQNMWDNETESYRDEIYTNTFEKVRMNKIESLIRRAERNNQLV
jgi:hypothetical protein